MSIQEQYDNYLKNLNYKIQAENVGLNSWGDIKRRLPSKAFIRPSVDEILGDKKNEMVNKQIIRQEQIQSYLEKERMPVVINGQSYMYNQAPEPTLDDLTPYQQQYDIDKRQIQALYDNNKSLSEDLNEFEKDYNVAIDDVSKIELDKVTLEGISQGNIRFDVDNMDNLFVYKNGTALKDYIKRTIKPDLSNFRRVITNALITTTDLLRAKRREANQLMNDIAQIKILMQSSYPTIENLTQNISILGDDIDKAKKANAIKVKNYEDQLKFLNVGQFNMQKNPSETDEEYLQRLTTNAQIPYDNSTTSTLSDIERNNAFKANIKTLVSNNSYVEQVLNYFRTNTAETYCLNEVNKYFAKFKKLFENNYGIDNPEILKNPQNMIDFILDFVQADPSNMSVYNPQSNFSMTSRTSAQRNAQQPQQPPQPQQPQQNNSNILTIQERQQNWNDILATKLKNLKVNVNGDVGAFIVGSVQVNTNTNANMTTSPSLYLIKFYTHDSSATQKQKAQHQANTLTPMLDSSGNPVIGKFLKKIKNPIIFKSESGAQGSWVSIDNNGKGEDTLYNFLTVKLGIQQKYLYDLFNTYTDYKNPKFDPDDIIEFFQDVIGIQASTNFDTDPIYVTTNTSKKLTFGTGISSNIENVINFGKVLLSYKKLILKNLLSIQQKNGNKVAGFNNRIVSDEFVSLINKLINKEQVLDKDIDQLKIGENALLDKLLSVAQIHLKRSGAGLASIKKAKENLEIVKGQILSGNNNPAMKKDLYHALFSLVHLGAIGEKQARQHYKEIIDNYF